MKYLNEAEVTRLFEVIHRPRDRAMFLVAYWRGLRASEIGLLNLADLDMTRCRLSVTRLKGSYSGEYSLSPDEVKALKVWLRVRGKNPGCLFPSQQNHPIGRGQVFHLFRAYAAKADLPMDKRHPRALKHSIATHLLDKGLGIMDVKDWLGHRDLKSTTIYAQVTNKRREQASEMAYAD